METLEENCWANKNDIVGLDEQYNNKEIHELQRCFV